MHESLFTSTGNSNRINRFKFVCVFSELAFCWTCYKRGLVKKPKVSVTIRLSSCFLFFYSVVEGQDCPPATAGTLALRCKGGSRAQWPGLCKQARPKRLTISTTCFDKGIVLHQDKTVTSSSSRQDADMWGNWGHRVACQAWWHESLMSP
jgi:hypothetical protein